jgi:branched-chain amino acid transport system ATP-binding protein
VSVLEVESLEVRHGLLQAVREVSFQLGEGETLALVGANGAGKSSLLRAIAGASPISAGRVVFRGEDVSSEPAHRRLRRGIALVPEGRRLFADLTVEENLLVARDHGRPGPWDVASISEAFPLIGKRLNQPAGNLSGGEQQATAIGRALMSNPRLLLLDEVSLGLAPVAIEDVYRSLSTVLERGTTVVIVEQDLARALAVAGPVLCMLEGRIVLSGQSRELTREQVTEAYFGLHREQDGQPA